MPSGGKREGAGRPRVRDKHAGAVRAAEKKIVDRLPEIVDGQIELALGVLVEDVNPVTGHVGVYRTPPDSKAGQYLINRILGLPQAKVNLDGSGGFRIHVVYGDDADTTD
jgi:hypothetical protein